MRVWALGIGVAFVVTGCGGGNRPSESEWAVEWEREQALVPTADELVDGGRPLCDELVGQYREHMTRLTPTPTDTLDDAVEAWVALAESIVFECPDDRAELDRRLVELDVLAAEIDAGFGTN